MKAILKLVVVAGGFCVSGAVIAESYRSDITLRATNQDSSGFDGSQKEYGGRGTYYIDEVRVDNLPLAEAAFLTQSSNVYADVSQIPGAKGTYDTQVYTLGMEMYVPEDFLYAALGAERDDGKEDVNSYWFTALGLTPVEGLLLTTRYHNRGDYLANLQLKYVTDLGDEQAMNVETAVSDADKGTDWLVGGDFYFDHAWSLGAAVEKKNAIDYYTLRTRYFFDSSFSGDLSYVDTSDKTEGTRITARLTLRF